MDGSEDDPFEYKEQYYRKLNDSLKRKAASLISQAENALKEQAETCASFDICNEAKLQQKSPTDGEPSSGPESLEPTPAPRQLCKQPPSTATPASDSDDSLTEALEKLDTHDEDQMSASSLVSRQLSGTAQARLYRAKLRAARSEIKRLKVHVDKLGREAVALNDKWRISEREQQRATIAAQKHESDNKRLHRAVDEANECAEKTQSELAIWKKEAEAAERNHQALVASQTQTEIKLRRATEEVERLRTALDIEKERTRSNSDDARDKLHALENTNKKLEKQKQELIVGFKKQMKLVDILKRQKIHLEGAKLLQISEDEFLKVVDLNLNE